MEAIERNLDEIENGDPKKSDRVKRISVKAPEEISKYDLQLSPDKVENLPEADQSIELDNLLNISKDQADQSSNSASKHNR